MEKNFLSRSLIVRAKKAQDFFRSKLNLLLSYLRRYLAHTKLRLVQRAKSHLKAWIYKGDKMGLPWLFYLRRTLLFARNIETVFQDRRFDLVINSDNFTLAAGHYAALACGAKRIYDAIELPRLDTRSGDGYDCFQKYELDLIHEHEGRYINQCDSITVIGPSFKQWFPTHYDVRNIQVVRNCRNFETMPHTKESREDLGLAEDDILVLFLNSVYRNQGIEQMIEALTLLPTHVHIATLGPVAQDSYREEITKLAQRHNVENRFHILPPKPWQDMLAYASGADIGIIPRQSERLNNYLSLPNRVFELIMARLPFASASLPDIAEIVRGYDIGEVFDQTSAESIASAILKLTTPDRLAICKKNIETAAADLCWEKEKGKFLSCVEGLFPSGKKLNVLFISCKDISKNNRVYRLCSTLTAAGHNVTVAAPYDPGTVQRDPATTYYVVPDSFSVDCTVSVIPANSKRNRERAAA